MEIRELYLKNFGKFSDRHFFIEDGLHILYGENEYGKSTVYAFIKAMLYGMERGRGRAAANDEFSQYEPWENPNYYAGFMRFSSGGKYFRLERSFDRYSKSASLICEDDGEVLSVEDGDLEMLLGGLAKDSFENTIAIRQLTAKPGQELAEELKNYAANYYETGSTNVDLGKALDTLRVRRKSIEQEIKALLEKQEAKKEAVRQEARYVSIDAEKLQNELEENQERLNNLQLTQSQNEKQNGRAQTAESGSDADSSDFSTLQGNPKPPVNSRGKSYVTMGVLGLLAGIAGRIWSAFTSSRSIFTGGGAISALSWIFLVIGAILVCIGCVKYILIERNQNRMKNRGVDAKRLRKNLQQKNRQWEKEGKPSQESSQEKDYKDQEEGAKKASALQKLEWESQRIKAEWKDKQVRFQNLQEKLTELDMPGEKIKSLRIRSQALVLAEEKMMEAARNMVQGFGDILNKKASEILEQITEGRYTRLLADEQLNLALFEDGRRIPVGRVSCGTIEQVYFALRMAAVDIMYEEPLPVIFDDAFAYYDDKRLKSTLKWLSEQQRQVIIFTCQKREQEISKRF